MGTILLTEVQKMAVRQVQHWFAGTGSAYFVVAGFAGTGKSTVVNSTIQELGLAPDEVKYVTFTGKAALVLTRKGCPAQTIHSLIYAPILQTYTHPVTRRERTRVTGFTLKKPEELEGLRLLVVDEVSMVNSKLLEDLASFNIPILALGDPGQLPPVQDSGRNRLLERPDVFLKDIHRQAAGNPILWASMRIREGFALQPGVYGGGELTVIPRAHLTVPTLLEADQVICGLNRTRTHLNKLMRESFGRTAPLPLAGDKIISLKNRWDEVFQDGTPLINGWIGEISNDVTKRFCDYDRASVFLDVHETERPSNKLTYLESNLEWFDPSVCKAKDSEEKAAPSTENNLCNFDYGYAITCHKSQGSEWSSGVYIHEPFGGRETSKRLCYTGLTRFSERAILVL